MCRGGFQHVIICFVAIAIFWQANRTRSISDETFSYSTIVLPFGGLHQLLTHAVTSLHICAQSVYTMHVIRYMRYVVVFILDATRRIIQCQEIQGETSFDLEITMMLQNFQQATSVTHLCDQQLHHASSAHPQCINHRAHSPLPSPPMHQNQHHHPYFNHLLLHHHNQTTNPQPPPPTSHNSRPPRPPHAPNPRTHRLPPMDQRPRRRLPQPPRGFHKLPRCLRQGRPSGASQRKRRKST